tara:strand:- start:228 stop:881 length:654 start_codon:yes stop_codon:yes gene_type:complete
MADVRIMDNKIVTAHCANPGSMINLLENDADVWISYVDNPKRKLMYTLEIVRSNKTLVGVNTNIPNRLIHESLKIGEIPELLGYESIKREVNYGEKSRVDFLLAGVGRRDCYIEVKSVTLNRPERGSKIAEFPDSVTKRGTKHLFELSKQVKEGNRAVMLYLVQRADCKYFSVADDIDPAYAFSIEKALNAGVELLCYDCNISSDGISIRNQLEIKI